MIRVTDIARYEYLLGEKKKPEDPDFYHNYIFLKDGRADTFKTRVEFCVDLLSAIDSEFIPSVPRRCEKAISEIFRQLDKKLAAPKPTVLVQALPVDPDWMAMLPTAVPVWRQTVYKLEGMVLTTQFALQASDRVQMQCRVHQKETSLSVYFIEPANAFPDKSLDIQVNLSEYLNLHSIEIFTYSKNGELEKIITPPL